MKTIYLSEPWTADADARLVQLDDEGRPPADAEGDGHKYFLELSVALEVLEVLHERPRASSTEDACDLLIEYAQNDAYPDWVYA